MKKVLLIAIIILLSALSLHARYIRINQAGYLPSDVKTANLFSNDNLNSMQFSVLRSSDNAVVFGPAAVGTNLGAYSGFSNHYRLSFTALNTAGSYFIRLSDGTTQSYNFEIGTCAYETAPAKVLNFLRAQRCGYNPHLGASCHMHTGTTRLDGRAVGGPQNGTNIDVSGGWHDAGDYIKFMINIANVTYFLLLAYKENPGVFEDLANGNPGANGIPDVLDEAKYGLDFIMKMHPSANVFYHQVADAIDHDTWRLPQADAAAYPSTPYRPVYHCDAGKGANIAGKAAAAFALAYTIYTARGDTSYANLCLTHAEQLYTFGKANPAAQPSTPTDFYNEDTWMDDMQLAAAELYKATGTASYLTDASNWAPTVSSGWGWTSWGVLNFYAHYALYPNAAPALQTQLKQFMQYDMNGHQTYANADLFGIGADYVWGSMAINTAGILNGYLYKKMFGETTYDALSTGMRDYLLGRNQWGVSFIVGIGTDYPNDSHHQIAAIQNSDITGMTIEGPVSQANWNTYGAQKPLPAQDIYNAFQSSAAVYYDYTYDYSTNEPTIWQAGLTLTMFSFLSAPSCLGTPTITPTVTRTNTPGGPSNTPTSTRTNTHTVTPTPVPPSGVMLDDFEDGEFTVNNPGGGWYDFADPASSSITLAIITSGLPSGGGLYSGHISGNVSGPVDSWASIGAGTNLNAAGTAADINSYTGIRLYMKGNKGTGTNVNFRIQLISTNITDYSFWGYNWNTVSADWVYLELPWTAFASPGWGQGAALTRSQVLSQVQAIQFSIADSTGLTALNTGNNWYIDSIEFYGGAVMSATPTNTPLSGTPTQTPTTGAQGAKCKRMLAYYPYWELGFRQDKLPYNRLTHICHAFVQPQADGSLTAPAGYLEPALITNAHAAGVKVIVSIGGADETARQNFVTIAASSALRTAFANSVEAFCRTYGYDGADIDWEFPQNAAERANQNLLIQAVRDKFNSSAAPAPSWEITMAVSPGNWYGQWNDYAYLNNVVDFYNLMNYDYHGSWSPHSGHNAPLYRGTDPTDGENIDWTHTYMTVTRGVPASKLNLGLAFYGYRFPSSETLYDNCGGSCGSAVQISYKNVMPLIGAGWTEYFDTGSRVPYLRYDSGAGLIVYDNPASITEKVNYALDDKGYGGIFMWEVTQDYNAGSTPLMDAMWNSYSSHCGTAGTPTNTATRTATATVSRTATATSSRTPTAAATQTATTAVTNTNTPTYTQSSTATGTATMTVTNTNTPSPTVTQTNSITPTVTETATETPYAGTPTQTDTVTMTATVTETSSSTQTPTVTPTGTSTLTASATQTFTPTVTATTAETIAPSPSFTATATATNTNVPSSTSTATPSRTATPASTSSAVPTYTVTRTATPTPTRTTVPATFTVTPTYTLTPVPDGTVLKITMTNTYPNPVKFDGNGSITAEFYITKRCVKAEFAIYTPAFRKVGHKSVQGPFSAGANTMTINEAELPSLSPGVYYGQLTAEGESGEQVRGRTVTIIIMR